MGNKLKDIPKIPPQAEKNFKRDNKVGRSFIDVVSGSFLSQEKTLEQMPFLLFLSILAIAYIANGYYAEEKIRELSKINNELKELKFEYIISKSELMSVSKQSEVAKAAEVLGIKESLIPPQKILIQNTSLTNKTED